MAFGSRVNTPAPATLQQQKTSTLQSFAHTPTQILQLSLPTERRMYQHVQCWPGGYEVTWLYAGFAGKGPIKMLEKWLINVGRNKFIQKLMHKLLNFLSNYCSFHADHQRYVQAVSLLTLCFTTERWMGLRVSQPLVASRVFSVFRCVGAC